MEKQQDMKNTYSTGGSKLLLLNSKREASERCNNFYVKLEVEDFIVYTSSWERFWEILAKRDDSVLSKAVSEVENWEGSQ